MKASTLKALGTAALLTFLILLVTSEVTWKPWTAPPARRAALTAVRIEDHQPWVWFGIGAFLFLWGKTSEGAKR